jgi:hypothetical protein
MFLERHPFWGTSDNIGQAGTALRGGDCSASAPMVRTIHGDDTVSGLAYLKFPLEHLGLIVYKRLFRIQE